MAFGITVLASGSKGNALHVQAGSTRFLVDCGLSCKEMEVRMEDARLDPDAVQGILVTHEHSDHIRGISVFSRRYNTPVYASQGLWRKLSWRDPNWHEVRPFVSNSPFQLNDVTVMPVRVPHDAADPVAFRIEYNKRRFGHLTDLGWIPGPVRDAFRSCDTLVLESNHDPRMLREGPYPAYLKHRVASKVGHLSNEESAGLLESLADERLQTVILAHLSETNNRPDLARHPAENVLSSRWKQARLMLAQQGVPLPTVEIS